MILKQKDGPRGASRVLKPGCVAFDYTDIPPHPTGIAPRLGYDGSFLITGGEPSREFDRLAVDCIEFHDSLTGAPPNAWDASEAEDCSVLAWLEGHALHFAAEGGVLAPKDCSNLFARYLNCQEIRFNGCFDTLLATNMQFMFMDCRSLTKLDLSGLDTSQVTNMYGMFDYCSSLKSLNLSGLDTSRVTEMRIMFSNCKELFSLNLSGLDVSQVANTVAMFENCRSLKLLDLSGFAPSRAAYMGRMFSNCSSLAALDLSGFDTSRAESLGRMFENCRSLKSLDLSGFDTSRVTDMSGMFSGCWSLTALDLSGFDTSRVTNMDGMFSGCNALLPKNIQGYELLPPGAQASLPAQDAAVRERLEHALEGKAAPKSAAAQKAGDWDTRTGRDAFADTFESLRLGAQDERVDKGKAARERRPQKESNPLWLLALVLLLLFGILAFCLPDTGYFLGGKWHHYPTPKPTMPTAQHIEDLQQQMRNLEQRLGTHFGSDDSATPVPQEPAGASGGD